MGKGNVCVFGKYEGLYYIHEDYTDVYRLADDKTDNEFETRLMGDLDYEELTNGEWVYDEWDSIEEMDDIIECFIDSFTEMFPSFEKVKPYTLRRSSYYGIESTVIMENKLFRIALEDNGWSTAVMLLQVQDNYDDHLEGLQKQHYQRYLDGMAKALLDRLPEIGGYSGAWTHKTITKEDMAI